MVKVVRGKRNANGWGGINKVQFQVHEVICIMFYTRYHHYQTILY